MIKPEAHQNEKFTNITKVIEKLTDETAGSPGSYETETVRKINEFIDASPEAAEALNHLLDSALSVDDAFDTVRQFNDNQTGAIEGMYDSFSIDTDFYGLKVKSFRNGRITFTISRK